MEARGNDKGIALVTTLFILTLLFLLGSGLAMATRGATMVSSSYRSQKIAFESAESGIEFTRESIRASLSDGRTLDELLRDGETLVDATRLIGFRGTTGSNNRSGQTPRVASRALGSAAFQVFLNNDRADGVTSTTDTNDRILLTSFGNGPTGVGFAAVQVELQIFFADLPPLPGLIVLPGPDVEINAAHANPIVLRGDDGAQPRSCYPTFAVSSQAALQSVNNAIASRPESYTTCDPGNPSGPPREGAQTTESFIRNDPTAPANPYSPSWDYVPPLQEGTPRLTEVEYLDGFVQRARAAVQSVASDCDSLPSLGSSSSPKVVVVNGDCSLNRDGAGILVVTGALTIRGDRSYEGLILVIGEGRVTIDGSGNGITIDGAMLVANTRQPWTQDSRYVGVPRFDDSGGGNSVRQYDSTWANARSARQTLPLEKISYQQLR